jgi:hypothetical protein
VFLTICLSSSTTVLELNNMRRLSFFSAADVRRIEETLKNNFAQWVDDFIFVDDSSLRVKPISIKDIDISEQDLFFYSDASMIAVLQDGGCNWAEFVFGRHLALCPRDKSFTVILDRVKQSFFSEVLLLSENPVRFDSRKKLLTGVNTYFSIEITGQAFGVFTLIVHQSQFYSLIEASKRAPSQARLSSRLSSISSLKVTATVKFDFGVVPFDELIQLNSTRVLSSSNSIKNQFVMSVDNVDICNVAVGKRANKKAFLILKEQ